MSMSDKIHDELTTYPAITRWNMHDDPELGADNAGVEFEVLSLSTTLAVLPPVPSGLHLI